jgi:hypothetical protein
MARHVREVHRWEDAMKFTFSGARLRHLLARPRRSSPDGSTGNTVGYSPGNSQPYRLVGQPQVGQPSEFESWPPHADPDTPASDTAGRSPSAGTRRA